VISVQRVAAIAANTFREAIRSKVLYTLVFFAVAMIGTGTLVSYLSYVERDRIMQSVGLSAIRLFGVLIAVFMGVGLVHREVERRTIYTILSRAISRTEFLVGKFVGLVATLGLQVGVMAIAFVAVSLVAGAPLGSVHAVALALAFAELAVVVAIATFFSSFTTPLLASLFTGGIYLVGHVTRDLRELGAQSDAASVERITWLLYRVLPDLESFNLSVQAVHGLPLEPGQIVPPLLYGGLYVALLLALGATILERRDLR
jgi:Cu-processing system permease protein